VNRKALILLLVILGFLFTLTPLLAQDPDAEPPGDEQGVEASGSEGEADSGNEADEGGALDETESAPVDEIAPVFDPSDVHIPENIILEDLPMDKGNAVALSWDLAPFDFVVEKEGVKNGEILHHYIFLINGSDIIEYSNVAKAVKLMSDSPQFWGFDDNLASRKWLLFEGFEVNEEVTLQIGVVQPELEEAFGAARDNLAAINKLNAENVNKHQNLALEKMRRKRPTKISELEAEIAGLEESIASLGYTPEEAETEWNDIKSKLFYFPQVHKTVTKTGWFNPVKTNNLIFGFLFGAVILWFISRARKDPNLFIRRISGLEAVDEAIGRATEMGKPILYLTGMTTLADLATLAAINILGEVAKKVAEYESGMIVPCRDPVVMTVNQETVKEAYTEAGRPDHYNEDSVFFLTEDQFSYTASVSGIMLRDKPAAIFFMGYYYAESLLLAETGSMTGAIQIAGTDSLAQLPFFITACDYTLIGEELYAASAYLSREPLLLGSLKGQDVGKLFLMAVILFGTLIVSLGTWFNVDGFDFIQHYLTAL